MASYNSPQGAKSNTIPKNNKPEQSKNTKVVSKYSPEQIDQLIQGRIDERVRPSDSFKKDLFKNTMSSVIDNVMGQTQANEVDDTANVYLQAASELYSSEDPYDQELARKYETEGLNAMSKVKYEPQQNPASVFLNLVRPKQDR